jgi:NADH dehydrogenase FAD-containing subunit
MTEETTQVVVLGAGYAGLMAAMRLARKTDPRAVTITLVASETFNERWFSGPPVRSVARGSAPIGKVGVATNSRPAPGGAGRHRGP